MQFEFYKYQGTGNDFVIVDNRSLHFPKDDSKLIKQICDRRFGVGADGLILLEDHPSVDFTMVYYNADGNPSSMCGNGGRCISHFAKYLGVVGTTATFEAVDGIHKAEVFDGRVSLQMGRVDTIDMQNGHVFLDTGSPHHVVMKSDLGGLDVKTKGAEIRYGTYGEAGANVNFVEAVDANTFAVRTYERGVEDETLSCGTGVTAVAIAMHALGNTASEKVNLSTPGGKLAVRFKKEASGSYSEVYLEGPVAMVYKGVWGE